MCDWTSATGPWSNFTSSQAVTRWRLPAGLLKDLTEPPRDWPVDDLTMLGPKCVNIGHCTAEGSFTASIRGRGLFVSVLSCQQLINLRHGTGAKAVGVLYFNPQYGKGQPAIPLVKVLLSLAEPPKQINKVVCLSVCHSWTMNSLQNGTYGTAIEYDNSLLPISTSFSLLVTVSWGNYQIQINNRHF